MGCFDFSDIVLDHFMNPRNIGGMDDANGIGAIGEPSCGDALTIYIQVNDNVITDISFLVHGCVAAIATSSITTELAKGKSLEEAYQITEEDVVTALSGLPDHKLHCSLLGPEALKKAIDDYRRNEEHDGWRRENA